MKRLVVGLAAGLMTAISAPSAAAHGAAVTSTSTPALAPIDTMTTSPLSGAVAVSPVGVDSEVDEPIFLDAGSPDYLVFSRSPSSSPYLEPEFGPTPMFVTDVAGNVTSLGTRPAGEGFSIAGDLMTSTRNYNGSTIDWIDLTDGTAGTGSIPSGSYYLGATSTGWAYVKDNELFTETTAGVSTSLGFPLGNAVSERVTSGGTGSDGAFVVDASSAVAYVRYADRTHPVVLSTLDLEQGRDEATQPAYMQCFAVATAAFCGLSPNTFPNSFVKGERLSLTGGAPVLVSPENGLSFRTAALDDDATASSDYAELQVSKPDGTGVVTDTSFGDNDLTSAFGKIAITNKAGTAIDMFDAPGDTPTPLIPATPAPVEASTAAISSGRVAYLDDEVSPTTAAPSYVWQRPIQNVSGQITMGDPSYVGDFVDLNSDSDDFRASGPLLSSSTTAVTLNDPRTENPATSILRPLRSTTVPARDRAVGQLSGNRALNEGGRGVRDTVTGNYVRLAKKPVAAALWGQNYCSMTPSGAVSCRDIDSGRKTVIRHSVAKDDGEAGGGVWMFGGFVAWSDDRHSAKTTVAEIDHPNRTTTVPASFHIRSLTSNGILGYVDDATAKTRTYELRSYGKSAHSINLVVVAGVLYQDTFPGLLVDSSVVSWTNDDGVVMAAPLPHVSDPPRYLGDPVAPKQVTPGTSRAWRAYLPYSASLSSCSVTVSRGKSVVQTLPCDPTNMQLGGAVVSWNGRTASGRKVGAGEVTWTVHAKNSDGTAIAAEGSTHAVTGTIKIKG